MRRAFFLISWLLVPPALAQTALPSATSWHGTPGGAAIGTLSRGTPVTVVRTSDEWTMVTVEGWVASFRLAERPDTLDRTVVGSGTAPIRAADGPTQPPVGEVVPGTVLKRLAERNGWTRVRRSAWVRSDAMRASAQGSAAGQGRAARGTPPRQPETATPPAASPPAARTDASATAAAERAARATTVRSNPGGGDERGSIAAGAIVETLARSGGWARVRLEGWVAEADLALADSGAAQLSAADLRSAPAAHRGKVVRWSVQVIAFQRADPLRRGLAVDEPYLLARGPGDENAILYLALPPALVDEARGIPALASIVVTARVRDGNSPPVGVPILDVTSLVRSP